jgi:hypothetical protein
MSEINDIDAYLDTAFELHDRGDGYAAIRKHFAGLGLEEEKIAYIIRLLDEFLLEEEKMRARARSGRNLLIFGTLTLLVGLLVVYLFWSNASLEGLYVALGMTPVVAGLAAMWTGLRQMRYWEKQQPEIDDAKLRLRRRFG